MNKIKVISPIALLLSSIAYFTIGFIFVFYTTKGIQLLVFAIKLFLIVSGVLLVLSFVFNHEKRLISTACSGLFHFILAALIQIYPNVFASSITFFIGLWILLNFVWRAILCLQLYRNKDSGFKRAIVDSLVSLVFGIVLVVEPLSNFIRVSSVVGIYLALYGLTLLGDFFREILKWDLDGKHIKRRIRWSLPVIFTAFIPQKFLNKINEALQPDTRNISIVQQNAPKEYLDSSLEIFIHMSPKIAFGFGHVDICFENVVYSYGTYDGKSMRMGGVVCDGVLVEMTRDKYIENCLNIDKERIVSFSIWLSEEQISNMRNYIIKFKENCIPWLSDGELHPDAEFDDPASHLHKVASAHFYKFKTGKFKTYFAVRTNCVQLADTFINSSGLDILRINGIITPGTYLAFYNNQFLRKNSIVVKRTIFA